MLKDVFNFLHAIIGMAKLITGNDFLSIGLIYFDALHQPSTIERKCEEI